MGPFGGLFGLFALNQLYWKKSNLKGQISKKLTLWRTSINSHCPGLCMPVTLTLFSSQSCESSQTDDRIHSCVTVPYVTVTQSSTCRQSDIHRIRDLIPCLVWWYSLEEANTHLSFLTIELDDRTCEKYTVHATFNRVTVVQWVGN